jgi:hypothetical protein
MRRVTVNALVDIAMVITFIPSLFTGFVLYSFLPSGGGRGGSWATWIGIPRHDWVLYHDIASFVFAALLVIHLLLHLTYFRNIRKCFRVPGQGAGCMPEHPQ